MSTGNKRLCQNDVQFQIMSFNFVINFVILNKHFELLNKYLPQLVVSCKVERV